MKLKSFLIVGFLCAAFPIMAAATSNEFLTLQKKFNDTKHLLNSHSLNSINTVKQHLALMVQNDQDLRKLFTQDIDNPKVRQLLQESDRLHTRHLKNILKMHGWITISKFGKEADRQAWLLVQHADHDPDFQVHCLTLLEKLLPRNETNKINYAYLYDRTAPKRGLKQKFGTQVNIEKNQMKLLPYEGRLEDVNKRRKEIGLEPLAAYLNTLQKIYLQK